MPKSRILDAMARHVWALLAAVPSLLVMRGMFSTDRLFCVRDATGYYWPAHLWYRHTIAAGESPLWDPYVAFGQSALADPTRHLMFPPILLLRFVPNEVLGFNLICGLPFPIAAVGMYAMLRRRLSGPAAAFGGVVFSICAPVLSTGNMVNMSWAAAILPWLLLAFARLADRATGARLATAAVLVCLLMLAGESVTFLAASVTAFLYAVVSEHRPARETIRAAVASATALACGVLLAAAQLFPALDATALSARGSGSIDALLQWALHPATLLEAITPLPFGDPVALPSEYLPWASALNDGREPLILSIYVGVGVVSLAVLGLFSAPRRRAAFWGALAGGAVLCALGGHTYFYPLLVKTVPVFRLVRFPAKYTMMAAFALAVLAAEGWGAIAEERTTAGGRRALLATLGVCAVAFGVAWIVAPGLGAQLGAPSEAVGDLRHDLVSDAPRFFGLAAAVVAACLLTGLSHRWARFAPALCAAAVVLDLSGASVTLNPQEDVALFAQPEWARLAAESGKRVYVSGRLKEYLPPRMGDTDIFGPIVHTPLGSSRLAGEIVFISQTAAFPSKWFVRDSVDGDPNMLYSRTYNVAFSRFLAAAPSDRDRFLERVGVRGQVMTHRPEGPYGDPTAIPDLQPAAYYESSEPFDRANAVSSVDVEPSDAKAINALFHEPFDVKTKALFDRDVPPAGDPGAPEPASARVVVDRAAETVVEATAPEGGGGIVVWDTYDPGWRVEVDGQRAELARAFGVFRGVRLAPGRHVVRFTYLPQSLVVGAAASAVGLLLLCVAAIRLRPRRETEGGRE